jgi:hypothetical protein
MQALVLREEGAERDRINNVRTPAISDIVVHVKVIGVLRRSLEIGKL